MGKEKKGDRGGLEGRWQMKGWRRKMMEENG